MQMISKAQSAKMVFRKNNPDDIILWVDNGKERVGEWLFTFDKQKIYNMFADYPDKLTENERAIFDRENPEWKHFFRNR